MNRQSQNIDGAILLRGARRNLEGRCFYGPPKPPPPDWCKDSIDRWLLNELIDYERYRAGIDPLSQIDYRMREHYKAPTPPDWWKDWLLNELMDYDRSIATPSVVLLKRRKRKKKRVTKKSFLDGLTVGKLRMLAKKYAATGRSKAELAYNLWKKTRGVPIEKLKKDLS